jgi:hypothetical protein
MSILIGHGCGVDEEEAAEVQICRYIPISFGFHEACFIFYIENFQTFILTRNTTHHHQSKGNQITAAEKANIFVPPLVHLVASCLHVVSGSQSQSWFHAEWSSELVSSQQSHTWKCTPVHDDIHVHKHMYEIFQPERKIP